MAKRKTKKKPKSRPPTGGKIVHDCGGRRGLSKRAKSCRKVRDFGAHHGLGRYYKNPDAVSRQVQQAIDRYTGFRGDAPAEVKRVTMRRQDRVVLAVGEVLGIMYGTVRDGQREKYLHRFTKKARPLLAVSSDGLQLYLIGGSYSVTDRGIVDSA